METALIVILVVLVFISIASLITNVIVIRNKTKADKEQQSNSNIQVDYQTLFGPLNQSIGKMESEIGKLSTDLSSVIRESSYKNNSDLLLTFNQQMKDNMNRELDLINKIQENLNYQLETSNKQIQESFQRNYEQMGSIKEATAKIQSAQLNLDSLSNDVNRLNSILTFSKPMGKYGERILGDILRSVFGETRNLFKEQATLKDSLDPTKRVVADALITLPSPLKSVAIDSKFSFEKFKNVIEGQKDADYKSLRAEFKRTLKQEIDKVASSYIIPNITADYALLFIPNDGIYTFLQTDDEFYNDVVLYGANKKVIITSPSTLQPILLNLNLFAVRIEEKENIDVILKNVNGLNQSLTDFKEAWKSFGDQIDKLVKKKEEFDLRISRMNIKVQKTMTYQQKEDQ